MRARRNSRADCTSFFGLFVDVVYQPLPRPVIFLTVARLSAPAPMSAK